MVYLPTFNHRNQPKVGKYTIHGWFLKVGTDCNSIRFGENRHESNRGSPWILSLSSFWLVYIWVEFMEHFL